MYSIYDELNRIDDSKSLLESTKISRRKKLTESYEIDGEEVTWPEYFDYQMEVNEYFMDDNMFNKFAEKAYKLVEDHGYTDVFTEPSTQAGRGGDFFWAKKNGISYRGVFDFETEQECFYDAAVSANSFEEAIDAIAKCYAKIILDSLKPVDEDDDIDEKLTENRNNPYFTPYGYRDAAKVLNGKAPKYYYDLKEIEMDTGDGIKLAKYALRKGLPVMVDKNSDPDYPEFAIKGEYHWDDYFYPYPTSHEEDLVVWDGKMFVEESLVEDASEVYYLQLFSNDGKTFEQSFSTYQEAKEEGNFSLENNPMTKEYIIYDKNHKRVRHKH